VRCARTAAPARWLHAAANASATSVGASTPYNCLPIFASVAASAAAISGALPEISSGTGGSCTNAPRGSPPSGGSHQPNSTPGPGVPGCRPAACAPNPASAACAADSSSAFSAALNLR
jgi:hypothetical protein